MDTQQRGRVADAVFARIAELDTSPEAIARAADLSGNTVRALLSGTRWPNKASRLRVELSLGWSPGALERIAVNTVQPTGMEGFSDRQLIFEQLRRLNERERRDGH